MRTLILPCMGAAILLAGCSTLPGARSDSRSAGLSQACVPQAATRIPRAEGECFPVAGRSYTQDDLRRTGAFTTGGALRLLDPAITVGR